MTGALGTHGGHQPRFQELCAPGARRASQEWRPLVLAPFQGPVACTRIKKGRGVCGTSWEKGITLIVNDVEKFPGHIACSSASRSEIVVPVFQNGQIVGVLDVDSTELAHFDAIDQTYLEEIVGFLDQF